MSLFARAIRQLRRCLHKVLRLPLLSHYVRNSLSHPAPSPYLLLEYIGPETGRMLSQTFDAHRGDKARRQRLFKGIAQIMLSLPRVPQTRIGSFQFHDDGTITLTNRPLSCSMMILENEGAPRTIPRGETYSCTDAFVSDTRTSIRPIL